MLHMETRALTHLTRASCVALLVSRAAAHLSVKRLRAGLLLLFYHSPPTRDTSSSIAGNYRLFLTLFEFRELLCNRQDTLRWSLCVEVYMILLKVSMIGGSEVSLWVVGWEKGRSPPSEGLEHVERE